MASIRITGFDQTKANKTAALEASASNPGIIYLNNDGTIVLNSKVYAKITGAKIGQDAVTVNNGVLELPSYPSDYIPSSQKGQSGGVAELDNTGKIPSSQLPSYVDDIIEIDMVLDKVENGVHRYLQPDTPQSELEQAEVSSQYFAVGEAGKLYYIKGVNSGSNDKKLGSGSTFELVSGEAGKIYVNIIDNKSYRWGGTELSEISSSLALGETSSTAYRGDRGKSAYDAAVANLRTTIRSVAEASDTALVSEKAIATRLAALEAALTLEVTTE